MTSKKDHNLQELEPIIANFNELDGPSEIIEYITQHSNLHGRRGNLELASAFLSIVAINRKYIISELLY